VACLQQLQRLFKQARRRHIVDQRRETGDRLGGLRADAHMQLGGKAHRAQHPHRIFPIAGLRVTDQANNTLFKILHSADVVAHGKIGDAVVEAVDGEVAALRVLFQSAIYVVTQDASAFVAGRLVSVFLFIVLRVACAERGDFDDFSAKVDMHQLEPATDDPRIAKLGTHLFGRGAGGHVEIFRRDIEQHVAYATAYQVSLVAGVLQTFDDIHRITTELSALQRMLAAVEHFRRAAFVLRTTQGRTE